MAKIYSRDQRLRIIHKLEYIRERFPRLSETEIAGRIAVQNGSNFQRRYLSRLRDHTLGDARVQEIIDWIKHSFDPSFDASLNQSSASHTSERASLGPEVGERWFDVDGDLTAAITHWTGIGLHATSIQPIVEARFLTFLNNGRLIRGEWLNGPKALFFEHEGRLAPFDGTRKSLEKIERLTPSTLGSSNVFEFASFVLLHLEGVRAGLVLSLERLLADLQGMRGGHLNLDAISGIFEPPRILIDESGDLTGCTFDAISGESYRRYALTLGQKLSTYQLTEVVEVVALRDITLSAPPRYSYAGAPWTNAETNLDDVFALIRQSKSTAANLNLLDAKLVTLELVIAPAPFAAYLTLKKKVLVGCRATAGPVELAAWITAGLYRAAAQMAGFESPDGSDVIELASYTHGLTMDVMTEICDFLNDILLLNQYSENIQRFVAANDLGEFWEAFRGGATRDQLYTHYTAMYERAQK